MLAVVWKLCPTRIRTLPRESLLLHIYTLHVNLQIYTPCESLFYTFIHSMWVIILHIYALHVSHYFTHLYIPLLLYTFQLKKTLWRYSMSTRGLVRVKKNLFCNGPTILKGCPQKYWQIVPTILTGCHPNIDWLLPNGPYNIDWLLPQYWLVAAQWPPIILAGCAPIQ